MYTVSTVTQYHGRALRKLKTVKPVANMPQTKESHLFYPHFADWRDKERHGLVERDHVMKFAVEGYLSGKDEEIEEIFQKERYSLINLTSSNLILICCFWLMIQRLRKS